VPAERRSAEEIRREIQAERDQLADALADLRAGVGERRRLAGAAAGAVTAGLAVRALVRLVRHRTRP